MEQELDLRDVFAILKKRFLILVLLPLLFAVISGAVSIYLFPPVYQSSTTLLRIDKDKQLAHDDLLVNRQLINVYKEIAVSRTVLNDVIKSLWLNMSYVDLKDKIRIDSVSGTEILKFSVEHTDPKQAQRIADQVAASFVKYAGEFLNIESMTVIDPADLPEHPVRPNVKFNILVAAMLGFMVSLGLAFLLELLDNTVKDARFVEEELGLTLLATVPVYGRKK